MIRPVSKLFVTLCLAAAILWSASVAADDDWFEEKPWQEDAIMLPKAVQLDALIEVVFSAAAGNRVFVDPNSLSVGDDRVVRFSLVTRSAGGATNVSYEGIRCITQERRIYAIGHPDGSWHLVTRSKWAPFPERGPNNPYRILAKDYFCPGGIAVNRPRQALDALRTGGSSGSF